MNFKRFLLFLVAPLAMVMSSCEPDQPTYTTPTISITDANGEEVTEVNFAAADAENPEMPIEQVLTIKATRGWSISKQAESDWLGVTPKAQTNDTMEEKITEVKISVTPNDGGPRTETLKIVMDKTEKQIVVKQAGEGQTELGADLYYDNFDKDGKQAQKGSNGWKTYLDGEGAEFLNPTPESQANVTYGGKSVSVRSNSANGSGGKHSNYEGSGLNYIWFGTKPTYMTVSGISLSELEGNALTLSFGTERYEYEVEDNTFNHDEFKVYISGDGEKWTEVEYTFLEGANTNGKWNIATAQFNLKEVPETLSLYFSATVASAYAIDDLKLTAGGGGTEIDLSQGEALDIETGGGNQGGTTEPDPNAQQITVAEFIEKADTATTYQLTGTISGSINTQYGNFDLVDESGSIYIYGLKDNTGANVNWANKGLNKGDVITLQGKYFYYAEGNKHEIKDALYISHVDGEGGEEPEPPVVGDGDFTSDSPFVQATDDSANCVYTLGDGSKFNGQAASGFKLGKSKQEGKFTSKAIGVSGDKYLNFYAVSWGAGGDKTIYFRVNGGEVMSQAIKANSGATGNPPYTITVTDSDHYSVLLSGLSESDVIEFSSNAAFDCATTSDFATRAIFFGVKLTDEALGGTTGGGTTPEPEPEPEPTPTVSTIAEVLVAGGTVAEGTSVEGVVISNSDLNNLTSKKGLYIQDETAGLQFYLAANHEFAFGDKVKIDLSGVTIGAYNGAVQVSGVALDKITKISSGNTVEAKTVSMADFLANKYEGQYVAIEGVQVAAADLEKTWVMGGAHTSIKMEDANGNNFVVFSSKYATYAAEKVAQGSGTIKGISSINVKDGVTTMQIIFAQATDWAGLTGARFGATVEPEEPETPVELAGSGEGTEASPYDVTRALDIIAKGVYTADKVYTAGVVSGVKEGYNAQYGNATYYISVDGTNAAELTVFRGKYLNQANFTADNQVKVGDKVVICGALIDYNGTPEINSGNYLVSIETAEVPEPEEPETPEEPSLGEWAGRDDFKTVAHNSQYTARQSTAGWVGQYCAVQAGGPNDANPVFPSLLGTDTNARAWVLNGKTTQVGVITSPVLTTGCGKLKFSYGMTFTEKNGYNFTVDIMQNGEVVKSFDIVNSDNTKFGKYTFEEEVNVVGEFQIVFTNNCPSNNSSSNKDRYSIWNVMWTAYAE